VDQNAYEIGQIAANIAKSAVERNLRYARPMDGAQIMIANNPSPKRPAVLGIVRQSF
jgi:hypothetical protein